MDMLFGRYERTPKLREVYLSPMSFCDTNTPDNIVPELKTVFQRTVG
jgi:hypothetical protein